MVLVKDASEVHNEASGTVIGPLVQAGTVRELHLHGVPRDAVVPQQLPAVPGSFVGRAVELVELTKVLAGHAGSQGAVMPVSVISGVGGIGKTWLALHWAYQHLDRFPDGQLFVDLRGFDPSGEPLVPEMALRGFLDALGAESLAIPVDLDAQVGLYRSLIAGRRILIVLDNVRDVSQTIGLLPGSASCTVIVTSRNRLAGLVVARDAHSVLVGVLADPEARALLTSRLSAERLAAEPEAVAEILSWCAGLPLALSIIASRGALHKQIPLRVLAAELRDASTRLDALDEGDPVASLYTVLSWSFASVRPQYVRAFELLALAPGPDISVSATASLTALSVKQANAMLRAFERMSLLEQRTAGRYRMHDLIRLFAADLAYQDQSKEELEAALRRLVDFYLHTAVIGDKLLTPYRSPIEPSEPVARSQPISLESEEATLAWFDAEHPNLRATQQLALAWKWDTAVWQLAWALDTFHNRHGHPRDRLAFWRAGLLAAERLGDVATQTRAHRLLGNACSHVGLHAEAVDHLQHALAAAQAADDLSGQAHTYRVLGMVLERQERNELALENAMCALRLFQTLGMQVWEAAAMNQVGMMHGRLGHPDDARACCEAALSLFRRHNHRQGEAVTSDSLGWLAHVAGQFREAADYFEQALRLFRDLQDAVQEAGTLGRLSQAYVSIGQRDAARDTLQQALVLYQTQQSVTDIDRVRRELAELDEA
jgi:tetratricopeptide (TPR) repeat protein